MKRSAFAALVFFAGASVALASWYDDYEAGMKAVSAGQWSTVIQKMTAAISANPKESNNARTYGNIFINYHPYYYRGLAYLRTGKYDQAIADFEKTGGPGELDRGSIETLMAEAKTKQAAASTPEPVPQPVVAQPQPRPVPVPVPQPSVAPQPAAPVIDPALRQRAAAAINQAKQRLAAAQQRKATQSPQYNQALQAVADANTRNATAKSNDDLNAVIALAENAATFADAAVPPGVVPVPIQPPTRPTAAAGLVLSDTAKRVRRALESYFDGDFGTAADQFTKLSQEMPKNGWIWAFLGASQYSQYAFEADEGYKAAALQSFRRAKQLRTWKNGLPEKYFSRRIRRVFEKAS